MRFRHAAFQPAHLSDPPIAIVFAARRANDRGRLERHSHRERRVDVGPLAGAKAEEFARRHADDASRNVVDADDVIDRVVAASEPATPQPMAHDHHRRLADAVVGVSERSSGDGHAERLKEIAADVLEAHLLGGRSIDGHRDRIRIRDAQQRGERVLFADQPPIEIRANRRGAHAIGAQAIEIAVDVLDAVGKSRTRPLDDDQRAGIADRQRFQNRRIDEAEDRRVRADADGQREDYRQREDRRLPQLPQPVASVLERRIEPVEYGHRTSDERDEGPVGGDVELDR